MARTRARNATTDTKRLAIIGGVGAVVVLGLLVFALTRGGSSSSSSSSPPSTAPSTRSVSERAQTSSTTTTTTTTPVDSMPDSFQTFTERNPFQPAVGVSTGVTTPTTTAGTATTATTAPPAPTNNGTGTATATTTPSQNPSSGTVVQLLEVVPVNGQPSARVQVASTVYTVTPGQTFATSYKLVSLSGSCGQFLFGDSPFQLCTGQQVLK